MTDVLTRTYPDRDARAGGRWSTRGLLDEVRFLAAVERALAHLVAGWVPKVPELDDKLRLAAMLEPAMARAVALRGHAVALLERDEAALTASRSWVDPVRAIDAGGDVATVLDGVDALRSELAGRYGQLAGALDELFDARLLQTVRAAVIELATDTAPATGAGAMLNPIPTGSDGDVVPLDDVLWEPLDRVPVPARPAGRPRPEAGSLGYFATTSRTDPAEVAGELNSNVMAELAAMELMCRCSYEHPARSRSFHLAVARHAGDEARHAAIFRRLLFDRGFTEGGLPQYGTNYELGYAFPECEVGSERELLWRLLVLCTVLEGFAIDKLPLEIATRDWLGQHDLARALDYITTDELFHAENGLRLTRQLCDELNLEPMLERELVHGRFFGRQRDVRLRYLEADPERAAREIEILDGPDPDGVPFGARTQVELRLRAAFTRDECDQVDRWGYNR